MGGVTIPSVEEGDGDVTSSASSASKKISPNSEALLRARLLKIELPSSSSSHSSICSNSLVSGRPTGRDDGNSMLYGDCYSPKSTPSTPHTLNTTNAYVSGVEKLNGSFGSFGRDLRGGHEHGGDSANDHHCHYSHAHHRKAKFDHEAGQCSLVFNTNSREEGDPQGPDAKENNLYVAGDAVARNREVLASHGITHVVNCCGYACKNYFETDDSVKYMTLCLEDSPTEEIVTVLYKVFDFIGDAIDRRAEADGRQDDESRRGDGEQATARDATQQNNVLVHCTMGVSRSVSICVAYMMHMTQNFDYEKLFKRVQRSRAIANPNIGFVCQLLQWGKRMSSIRRMTASLRLDTDDERVDWGDQRRRKDSTEGQEGTSGYEVLRIFRMAPHSRHDPTNIVPKLVQQSSAASSTSKEPPSEFPITSLEVSACIDMSVMDPRFTFIIQIVWIGGGCDERLRTSAVAAAKAFERYELYRGHRSVIQGEEDEDFLKLVLWDASMLKECPAYNEDISIMKKTFTNRTRRPVPRPLNALAMEGGREGAGAGSEMRKVDESQAEDEEGEEALDGAPLTRTCSAPIAAPSPSALPP